MSRGREEFLKINTSVEKRNSIANAGGTVLLISFEIYEIDWIEWFLKSIHVTLVS